MARSPRAPGAIGSDDYTGFSLILICVGLAILGWTAWKLWHAEISAGALLVAHREMQAIAWVSDRFSQADIGVQRADPAGVQFNDLVRLYRNIGTEFLYPAMALVLGLAALSFFRAGNARFTRAFDLDKLMAEQAKTSRSTAAFVGRNLTLSGVRAGDPRPADPALHVSEWIAKYAQRDGRFHEASARRELVRQLGAEWKGRSSASPTVRCMLAAFALHGAERRDEAARLLGLLSEGLPVDKTDRRRRPRGTARLRSKDARRRGSGSGGDQGSGLGHRDHGRASFYHAGPHVGPERGAPQERRPGSGAVRVSEARRSPALVRPACARVRVGRPYRSSASEPAGRGDRRARPLGGRARGRRAHPDARIRRGDRRHSAEDGREGGRNLARFSFAPCARTLWPMSAPALPSQR